MIENQPADPDAAAQLPRTGAEPVALVRLGGGLLTLGAALVLSSRRRTCSPPVT